MSKKKKNEVAYDWFYPSDFDGVQTLEECIEDAIENVDADGCIYIVKIERVIKSEKRIINESYEDHCKS